MEEDRNKPNPDYVTPWYLRVRRSDHTKRQWRRLRPKIIAAAKADGVNPAYVFSPYDVVFYGRPCAWCGGYGRVDSGGANPDGSPIWLPCPCCR